MSDRHLCRSSCQRTSFVLHNRRHPCSRPFDNTFYLRVYALLPLCNILCNQTSDTKSVLNVHTQGQKRGVRLSLAAPKLTLRPVSDGRQTNALQNASGTYTRRRAVLQFPQHECIYAYFTHTHTHCPNESSASVLVCSTRLPSSLTE